MGNFSSTLNSTNIQQTQITDVIQSCNIYVKNNIDNIDVRIINSKVGDLVIDNELQITDMNCVINSIITQSAANDIANKTTNEISVLPFQFNVNSQSNQNNIDIYSMQMAITRQTCNEQISSEVHNANLTYIDSTTGNILIANKTQIGKLSCQLTAGTSNTLSNQVTNDTSNSIQESLCCGGVCFSALCAGIAIIVMVKVLGKGNKKDKAIPAANMQPLQYMGNTQLGNIDSYVNKLLPISHKVTEV